MAAKPGDLRRQENVNVRKPVETATLALTTSALWRHGRRHNSKRALHVNSTSGVRPGFEEQPFQSCLHMMSLQKAAQEQWTS